MIAKSKYKNLVSIFLLVLTMILSCTSVFATEPNTRANGWDEDTHQSLENIWEKYSLVDGSCDGTFRPDGTCSNEYSCGSCGDKADICGPVKCDRCDGMGRHMGQCHQLKRIQSILKEKNALYSLFNLIFMSNCTKKYRCNKLTKCTKKLANFYQIAY